jgi:hypothetical protein
MCVRSWASEWHFVEEDTGFSFKTPVLSGTLKGMGASRGLTHVADSRSGGERVHSLGLFSLYRVFDRTTRFGDARSRRSESRLLPNGAVEYRWPADAQNPFEMRAVYQWVDEESLDFTLSITPGKDLGNFEAFLSSYVGGSDRSFVYTGGKGGPFTEALRSDGVWQMFPRDKAAVAVVNDGRWKRPPNPVAWVMRPEFAGVLGMRRNTRAPETTLVMARPSDCFAVSTPFGMEGHRSLYLSLFGRDIKAGQTDTVRARLVLAQSLTDEQAIAHYERFLSSRDRGGPMRPGKPGSAIPRIHLDGSLTAE